MTIYRKKESCGQNIFTVRTEETGMNQDKFEAKPATMSFTDEDLKRLKHRMSWAENLKVPEYQSLMNHEDLKALLARLEAAEKALEAQVNIADLSLIRAWRNAAGKSAGSSGSVEVTKEYKNE
jgi:hypothetical protein